MSQESIMKINNLKRNIVWNLIGATSNATTSLFFMIIVTRVNGLKSSGIFTLAFSLACLFCILGGYQGRIFQVTDVKKEFSDKEYILHRYLTFLIMMFFCFLYTIIKGYSFDKTIITLLLCLMKGLEVLADVYYGIMQKNDVLYKCGFSLTLKAALSIILFLAFDIVTKNLIIACSILVVIWLLIFIIYDIPQTSKYIDKQRKIDIKNTLKIFRSGFFAFIILFLSVYLVNVPKYALDGRVADNLIATFGIILMPATLISLCAQYVLQPFLPKISLYYAEKKWLLFKQLVRYIMLFVSMAGASAIIAGYLFGLRLLEIVYNVDLEGYMVSFIIIILGAIFYALCMVLSAVLTTIRRTFQQFVIYAIISLFGYICSMLLVENMALDGAVYSYFLIMFIQFILYMFYYQIAIYKLARIGE